MITLNVNGRDHALDADPTTPLLYVLRDNLQLNGAKFGCGLGQCGACTVLIDGEPVYSCVTPIAALAGRRVRTIEGLGTAEHPSPLQQAFIDEQAAQCGYCIAGMIMRAQALLERNAAPTDEEIRAHMKPCLCCCGTHMRILRAVHRVAGGMQVAGSTWTLYEAVWWDGNRIASRDWNTYPILGFASAPRRVDVHLIERPDTSFLGTGEAAQGPTAAALANAVADATGVRIRDLPLTRRKVAAALAG